MDNGYDAIYLEYERETDLRRRYELCIRMLKALMVRIGKSTDDVHITETGEPTVYQRDVIWDVQNKMRYDYIQELARAIREQIRRGYD